MPVYDPDAQLRDLAQAIHRSTSAEVAYLDKVERGEIIPNLTEYLAIARRGKRQLKSHLERLLNIQEPVNADPDSKPG